MDDVMTEGMSDTDRLKYYLRRSIVALEGDPEILDRMEEDQRETILWEQMCLKCNLESRSWA